MTHYITFKRKAFEVEDNGVIRKAIYLPKKLTHANTTLTHSDHNFYNQSFFPTLLHRKLEETFGRYREFIFTDEAYNDAIIDSTGFLVEVKIPIERNYR